MSTKLDCSKKSFVLITGASRGIGRTIAVELAKLIAPGSIFLLLARSEAGLEETKQLILNANPAVTVDLASFDFNEPDLRSYENVISKTIKSLQGSDFENGICFHNAGTTGEVTKVNEIIDLNIWQKYYTLNVFSVMLLNSTFLKLLRPLVRKLFAVNITSLAGRTPFPDLGIYGSGKAARDLLFKVLSVEEKDVVVFNYSPGPVDTDMFNNIVENAASEDTRKTFAEVKKSVLTTTQTVTKLLDILKDGSFNTGDTVDYFDRIEQAA